MTFKKYKYKDILKMWLKSKQNIKIQSYIRYEYLINCYLIPSFEGVTNKNINKEMVIKVIENFKSQISTSMLRSLVYILKSSIKFACTNDYMDYINLDELKLKGTNKTIYVLAKEEQYILEEYLKEKLNIRKVCLLLCLYTGLRIGEVCGLKWEDINLINKSLEVKRTIERIKNKNINSSSKTLLIASTPKSDTSNRVIPIPDFLISLLAEFESNKEYYLLSNSPKLYDPRCFEEFYRRTIKSCNLNYINFHTLRHTFATRAIETKMDVKTLSEILGHSSIEITLKLYVHPSFELKKKAIENLVDFMTS